MSSRARATGCSSSFGGSGPDAILAVELLAGQTLDVTQTTDSDGDAVLYFLNDCAASGTSCIDSADSGFNGDPESLSYTNSSTSTETIYIVADEYFSFGDTGTFGVEVTIQ